MSQPGQASRAGGILLHPTSIPGSDGIGDLGENALRWMDWLHEAGCRLWQVLPLGPTGYGDSPYQSLSAMAGNPMLISLDQLIMDGLLYEEDKSERPAFGDRSVDYGEVIQYKENLLQLASRRFHMGSADHLKGEFHSFCDAQAAWLDDFTLFMALKQQHGGSPWTSWEPALRHRSPQALMQARETLEEEIEDHRFRQFIFYRQWATVKRKAQEKSIRIIGDVPIFLAHDSVDVWSHPELFYLDEEGMPLVVAGVPPDYFSPTGQLWGNPLYRWDKLRQDGYAWWKQRLHSILTMVDCVRLDHFRGFDAYWEIPASATTAVTGRWVPGPGSDFFKAIRGEFDELPFIAEDLGLITEEVEALREMFNLPGMKVLQFAFEEDPSIEFLPHHFTHNCVVYTGTHDNDTSRGWYESSTEQVKDFCRKYLASDGVNIAWDMIRAIWASVADLAIVPMQDFLGLGSEARMNFPSRAEGNWTWRVREEELSASLAQRIHELNTLYSRVDDGAN
jgi:4-alpha-glucanotransferase